MVKFVRALTFVALATAGCGASGPRLIPVSVERAAAPAAVSEPRKWAANFRTPNLCEMAARQEAVRSASVAFRLLQACSLRSDYDVLEPLLRQPWLPIIKRAKEAGLDVLVRTISRREEFTNDAGACQAAGIELIALSRGDALIDAAGAYVWPRAS